LFVHFNDKGNSERYDLIVDDSWTLLFEEKMADKTATVEAQGSSLFFYVSTFLALVAGLVVARGILFPSKKKGYRSGLHREIALPSMRSIKQHVTKTPDGGFLVRPSEGMGKPEDDLVDYAKYDAPHTGVKADYAGPERRSKKGIASFATRTVMNSFERCVKRAGNKLALKSCDGKTWTWAQYYEEVNTAAKALISIGFQSHDSINILGFNAPEWLILDCAAIFANGMAAGVYTTNNTEACEYIAQHSKAKLIAVENLTQLDKYVPVAAKLPCKTYVIWQPTSHSMHTRASFLQMSNSTRIRSSSAWQRVMTLLRRRSRHESLRLDQPLRAH